MLRAGDRQPLGGLSVIVDGGDVTAVTNGDGRFAFAAPPGPHVIHVVGAEVAKSDFKVTLNAGKSLTTTWYVLAREPYRSTVRGQRPVVEAVETTLSGDELRHIPGTQGDTLKAVQNLPGVARSPFGGGLLVVWGSAPQDTRTYVDGVYIPTLYHFGGLRSTVNSEMVSSLQLRARRLRRRARARPRRRHRGRDAQPALGRLPRLRADRPHRRLAHDRRADHEEPLVRRRRAPLAGSTCSCPSSPPTTSSSRPSTTTTRPSCTGTPRRATTSTSSSSAATTPCASWPRARPIRRCRRSSTRTPTITASWRAGCTASPRAPR